MTAIQERLRDLDVGNIVALEHFNVCIPDQKAATEFYVMGLGLTRDPYMRVGTDGMGINIGRGQFHLGMTGGKRRGVTRGVERLRGVIGLVLPDLGALAKRLEKVTPLLAGTQFSYRMHADHVDATCPWGNRFRCHAPSPEFGNTELALAYIESDVPRGTASGIARFYREMLLAPVTVEQRGGDAVACVSVGAAQQLMFHETDRPIPEYDGHHIQIYIANYSVPFRALGERGLVIEDSVTPVQFNFENIVDLDNGKLLYTLEHEVRCLKHPAYNRPLVNRNTAQTNNHAEGNHDEFRGTY